MDALSALLVRASYSRPALNAQPTQFEDFASARHGAKLLLFMLITWVLAPVALFGQNVVINPTGSQNITQPVSSGVTTQFSANNIAGARYAVASYNWLQTDSMGSIGNLASASSTFAITTTSESSTTGTFNTSATCNFTTGTQVLVQGVSVPGYNGGWVVLTPGCNGGSSFTATLTSSGLSSGSGGTGANGQSLTLTPCPVGLDVSANTNALYAVRIAGTGAAESAPVAGGSCSSGAASGTVFAVTANTHAAGFTVGSANSGIQEALNDADGISPNGPGAVVVLGPTAGSTVANYEIYNTVFQKSSKSFVSGYGALLQCFTRAACWIVGNYLGGAQFSTFEGVEFQPGLNIDGVRISSVSATSGTYTVTTATNHPFVVGDYVILFYSNNNQTQEGRFQVATVPAANQFTYRLGTSTISSSSPTYGWAALENAAIEDISDHLTIRNIHFLNGGTGTDFSWGVVVGNDQSFKLDGLTNEGGAGNAIKCTSNFCGAMVYGRGDQGAAPVMNIDHAEISMQCSGNGVRYNSGNTLHVWNSVIQGFNQYGVYYAGGLQNVMLGGVYQESGACTNPFYAANQCAGSATCGASAGIITNNDLTYVGDDPLGGQLPSFLAANPGSQQNNYYVVVKSSNLNSLGMYFIGSCFTTGTGNCTTYWPEPNLDSLGTVTYDVLVTVGSSAVPPNGTGNYKVGSVTGSSSNCTTSGICTFVDPQTGTSSYSVPPAQGVARLNFWPGGFVLGNTARLHINDCGQASSIVTTSFLPSVFCNKGIAGSSAQRAPYWATYKGGDSSGNGNPAVGAVIQQAGPASGAASSGLTGLYGFLDTAALGQTDMITLAYTSPFLALATPGYRPAANSTDTAIGLDNPAGSGAASGQLAFRAPVDISFYIDHTFDNAAYLERLSASAKTFTVPVTLAGSGSNGTLKAARYMGGGSAPTCTFTSGGGTSPSCSLDTGSTDTSGIIIATTGTGSPAGTGTITLTFSTAFGTNKPVCQYQASDVGAGTWNGLAVMKDKGPLTSSDLFTWTNGTTPTALSTSAAYWINYQCFAK